MFQSDFWGSIGKNMIGLCTEMEKYKAYEGSLMNELSCEENNFGYPDDGDVVFSFQGFCFRRRNRIRYGNSRNNRTGKNGKCLVDVSDCIG